MMKTWTIRAALLAIFTCACWTIGAEAAELSRLQVSENGRFLVREGGLPFFWLGNTAWRLARLAMHFAQGMRRGPWSGMGFSLVEAGGSPRAILRRGGDGALGNAVISRGEPFEGLRLRTSTDLKINHLWLEHYVDEGAQRQNKLENPTRVNRVWFDDIVVSTAYLGPIKANVQKKATEDKP